MKIVYLVTCGEYSDYDIKGPFSTRELAEAYIAKMKENDRGAAEGWYNHVPRIEEYYLDAKYGTEHPEGKWDEE